MFPKVAGAGQYDLTTVLWERREQHFECSNITFFSFLKQILCVQKIIIYHWIHWKDMNYLSYRYFRNIFLIKNYGNQNLRVFVLFLYTNALHAAPLTIENMPPFDWSRPELSYRWVLHSQHFEFIDTSQFTRANRSRNVYLKLLLRSLIFNV